MKKILYILFCIIIISTFIPFVAMADEETVTTDQQTQVTEEQPQVADEEPGNPEEEPEVDPIEAEKAQYSKLIPTVAKIRALKDGEIELAFNPLKNKNVVSYKIQRSTNKNFTKNIRNYTKKQKKDIIFYFNGKHMKKGTKYYYRVRAVVKLSDGTNYLCPWSKTKSAKCKRTRA